MQDSICVKSDNSEEFSEFIAKIFGGFNKGNGGLLEKLEDREDKIRQRGKNHAEGRGGSDQSFIKG